MFMSNVLIGNCNHHKNLNVLEYSVLFKSVFSASSGRNVSSLSISLNINRYSNELI